MTCEPMPTIRQDRADLRPIRRRDRLSPLGLHSGARIDDGEGGTGFLHAPVAVTRSGIFIYRNADGSISRELKHPEEVFRPESVKSAERLIATRGHPRDAEGRGINVTVNNVDALKVGHLGDRFRRESRFDEEHLVFDLTITNRSVRDEIVRPDGRPGRDQVSMGYTTIVIPQPGEWQGEKYDAIHTHILYNHIAVALDAGRGGHTVAVQLDEQEAVMINRTSVQVPSTYKPDTARRNDMPTVAVKVDDMTLELEPGMASLVQAAFERRDAQIAKLTSERDTATGRVDAAETRATDAEGKLKTATDRADKAEADLKTKTDELEANTSESKGLDAKLVKSAVCVLDDAATILGWGDLTPEQVGEKRDALMGVEGDDVVACMRRAVVMAAKPEQKETLAKKGDEYIEATFDALRSAAGSDSKADDADDGKQSKGDSTSHVAAKLLEASSSAPKGKTDGQSAINAALFRKRGRKAS